MKTAIFLGIAFASVLWLVGCVAPEAPNAQHTTDWAQKAKSLMAERATREKVESTLGRPACDFPDLRVIGYTWSARTWFTTSVIGFGNFINQAPGGGGGLRPDMPIPQIPHLLWLTFDDRGRLKRYDIKLTGEGVPTHKQAARWTGSNSMSQTSAATTTQAPLSPQNK
jgi:hypothetical protein